MTPLPVEVDIDSELAPGKVIVGQGEWQEKGLCLLLADFVEGFKDPEHVRSPLSTERLDEGFGTHANMVPTHDVIEGGRADALAQAQVKRQVFKRPGPVMQVVFHQKACFHVGDTARVDG